MSNMIKYVVECDSLYGVVALLILCILLGLISLLGFITLIKLVPYIIDKITTYNDVHAKAESNNSSFEVDLHRREEKELL